MIPKRRTTATVSALPSREGIDLAASKARIVAARRLAVQQGETVAGARGGADEKAIDLLMLLDESVLLFEETDAMLTRLAARESRRAESVARVAPAKHPTKPRRRSMLLVAAQVAVLVVAAAFLLEILDPAPMEVAAFGLSFDPPVKKAAAPK